MARTMNRKKQESIKPLRGSATARRASPIYFNND